MSEHTPTPWKWQRRDGMVHSCIEADISVDDFPFCIYIPCPPFALGATGMLVARTDGLGASAQQSEANTRFIVRAVNNHDRLLAACKAVSAAATEERAIDLRDMDAAIGIVREAIKAAEEGA